MAMTHTGAPEALHLGAADLPFVEIGDGNKLKVIHVDEKEGLWIVENIFQAGYAVQKHRHTGPVWGYTTSGAWKYAEYDYVNRAGSLQREPNANSCSPKSNGRCARCASPAPMSRPPQPWSARRRSFPAAHPASFRT